MNINVTKDNITISDEIVHSGEFNVNELNFTFSDEYTDNLVKKVVFSTQFGSAYAETIINGVAIIPLEAVENKGNVLLGVYAYEVEGTELVLRYSPKPIWINVEQGSYVDAEDGTVEVPALTIEQYEQALNEILTNFEFNKQEIIDDIVEDAETTFDTYYDGKVSDFNDNATSKTNTFNQNATDKTDAYNSNATSKTTAFNQNAIDKTNEFDQHVDEYERTWRGTQAQYDLLTKDENTQYFIEEG